MAVATFSSFKLWCVGNEKASALERLKLKTNCVSLVGRGGEAMQICATVVAFRSVATLRLLCALVPLPCCWLFVHLLLRFITFCILSPFLEQCTLGAFAGHAARHKFK